MKKVLLVLAFAFTGYFSLGQNVNKGNLMGIHLSTPNLKEGVTMQEYKTFFKSKVIPAYEKAFPGMKMYLLRSVRGQDSSSMGLLFLFNREADRNKYFNNDGTTTDLFKKAMEKLDPISKEMNNYVEQSDTPDRYNDWLIE